MHSPEVQTAFDRLKRLRQNHSPRVVYSSETERSLLSYAEINRRVREDERVVLEWYLDNSAGMNILCKSDESIVGEEWFAVLAGKSVADCNITDGWFCDKQFVERLYEERKTQHMYVTIIKRLKG